MKVFCQGFGFSFDKSCPQTFVQTSLYACGLSGLYCAFCRSILFFQHAGSFVYESFSGLRICVENNIFNTSEQFRFYVVIYLKHRRIDDCHVQACLDRVIEEC